jgi:hypothetical protein
MAKTIPNMTRKHYQFIAEVIAEIDHETSRHYAAHIFADHLAKTNSGFDVDRFLNAIEEARRG